MGFVLLIVAGLVIVLLYVGELGGAEYPLILLAIVLIVAGVLLTPPNK